MWNNTKTSLNLSKGRVRQKGQVPALCAGRRYSYESLHVFFHGGGGYTWSSALKNEECRGQTELLIAKGYQRGIHIAYVLHLFFFAWGDEEWGRDHDIRGLDIMTRVCGCCGSPHVTFPIKAYGLVILAHFSIRWPVKGGSRILVRI